jgi:hypothetical protein
MATMHHGMALAARCFGQGEQAPPIRRRPRAIILAARQNRMTVDLTAHAATWLIAEVLR